MISSTAPFGTTTSINILNNDDFLANDGNTITRTGVVRLVVLLFSILLLVS
ncbi:MAG: hypothetical protein IPN46_08420 [Saprospiraceae bacterium]|nr:hypothetical protein [Saprospiraceae bacterium]